MSATLVPLKDSKTILLTTYKRDGTGVSTPVSIAFAGDRAFFRSYDKTWKTKRLRRDPHAQAAPSTLRGKPTGPAAGGAVLRHTVEGDAVGRCEALWRERIEPAHDVVLEALLDNLQAAVSGRR